MTKRKIDPCVKLPPQEPRRHYACRVRLDLWDSLKLRCARLNCSQGVYLEILLEKVFASDDVIDYVSAQDVFKYTSQGEKKRI